MNFFICSFLISINIPSESMSNTIKTGDKLIALKSIVESTMYNRYDIVVFKYPLDESKLYIKRIIGLPGESIDIINAEIYVNNNLIPLNEPYIKNEWLIENNGFNFKIPENHYLMLGDNRNESEDARYWGKLALKNNYVSTEKDSEKYIYVSKDNIVAKVLFKYTPNFEILNKIYD